VKSAFAVVLLAGVGAAVGVSLLLHRGDESAAPVTLPDPAPAPAPKDDATPPAVTSEDPKHATDALPPLAARVEDLLAKKDFPGAARIVLASDAKDLSDASIRDRAFRIGDGLVASAGNSADKAATALRMDARRIFSMLYTCDATDTAQSQRAFDACASLNQSLIFGNGAPPELVLRHTVREGESVWALAKGAWKEHGVSVPPGFVLHVNGISDPRRLRVGQTLRVPLERMQILVRKSKFDLTVLLGGAPVDRFPVAVGADASTPEGVFKIRDRIKNPDWYYHGKRIPFGDPQNIIGTRWLGLTGGAAADGIGIHGTADDASIGKAVSLGCVRMHNADVERLFEWVDAGIEVEIRD
jgi:nucleoid-associated protein YgaU